MCAEFVGPTADALARLEMEMEMEMEMAMEMAMLDILAGPLPGTPRIAGGVLE